MHKKTLSGKSLGLIAVFYITQAEAQQGPLFSTVDWGISSAAWGEVQSDRRATRISGTSDSSPLDDLALEVADVNGDGCSDVFIGLPEAAASPGGGEVRIYFGTAQGWEQGNPQPYRNSVCKPPSPPVQSILREEQGFGAHLVVTDLSGDGWPELVVSAPSADVSLSDVPYGSVSVFAGYPGGICQVESVRLIAGKRDESLGSALSVTPDFTGDGLADLWIATGHSIYREGAARLLLMPGSASFSLRSENMCPERAPERTSADTLEALYPPEALASGAGLKFGQTVSLWGERLLISDPTGKDDVSQSRWGVLYQVERPSGNGLGALTLLQAGDKTTISSFGSQVQTLEGRAAPAMLVSAPTWGYLGDSVYTGKLGRLTYLEYGSTPLRQDWERPAWDLVDISEGQGNLGLGSVLRPLQAAEVLSSPLLSSELVVGNPDACRQDNTSERVHPGRVYLVAREQLLADLTEEVALQSLPASLAWEGENLGDCFGIAASGGDFNGDGLGDLVVRAGEGGAEGLGSLTFLWSVELLLDLDGDGFVSYPALLSGGSTDWSTFTDGLGHTLKGLDCDERNPLVHAMSTELCNGIDDNCDGAVDEGLKSLFYRDRDGDGYGVDDSSSNQEACTQEQAFAAQKGDCDDTDGLIHPSAEERCNGTDDNCDGAIEFEGTLEDADGDGWLSCGPAPSDCRDDDADVYPTAPEAAGDGLDSDCDGEELCYLDADQDGYGSETHTLVTSTSLTCPTSLGLASRAGMDCDDTQAAVFPGATEDYSTERSESCQDDHFVGCAAPVEWEALSPSPGCVSFQVKSAASSSAGVPSAPAGVGLPLLALLWMWKLGRRRHR